jgi:hypothetical protein
MMCGMSMCGMSATRPVLRGPTLEGHVPRSPPQSSARRRSSSSPAVPQGCGVRREDTRRWVRATHACASVLLSCIVTATLARRRPRNILQPMMDYIRGGPGSKPGPTDDKTAQADTCKMLGESTPLPRSTHCSCPNSGRSKTWRRWRKRCADLRAAHT